MLDRLLARRRELPFRASWRLRRWLADRGTDPRIQGGLERPDRRQRFSRTVDVRGWVSAPKGVPVAVDVWIGGRSVRRLALTPSPDPPQGDAIRATFDDVLPLASVSGRAWLRVIATSDADPKNRRVLGVALLARVRPGDRQPARAAYGPVWDAVSGTLSDARFSVAGTADPEAFAASGRSTADDIAREAGVGPEDTVLEIGCGVGRIGQSLAPRCARWIGADVSREMLRHARAALAARPNVSFVLLNGINLEGIDDRSVDVAYCSGVFMHLDEWERYRYLTEAYRVLKPGGRIYVDNIDLVSPEGWRIFLETARIDPLARPTNVSKTSTAEELKWFATQAGFTDVRLRPGTLWITVLARKP
jgi:SAM-dependent methyltransferase